jgi:hypothetical protein
MKFNGTNLEEVVKAIVVHGYVYDWCIDNIIRAT